MADSSIAFRLAEFGLKLRFEDLPALVVEKIKDLVLDTMGICAASAEEDFGRNTLSLVTTWGGAPEATLMGGGKVPAQNAAYANGVLAHGLDYDDTHTASVVHPSACLIPAAFAAGEKHGRSGRDLLTDLAASIESTIRIGLPAHNRLHMHGFHTSSICGTFGAALCAGRMMEFDLDKMIDALGICGSFTSGLLECLSAGSGAKRLHTGWAGLCGIVAAQMAAIGTTGPASVFEGRLGLYQSFLRDEPLDLEEIFQDIGQHWEILDVRPKLYPACHYLQAFIEAVKHLKKTENLNYRQIEKIDCRVSSGAANIVCNPWDAKLSPQSGYDSRFSLPYAVAVALARENTGLAVFSQQHVEDPELKNLMHKVHYEVDPAYEVKDMPAFVRIVTKDGRVCEHFISRVRGNASNPIRREELLTKFIQNSAQRLDEQRAEALAAAIVNLEATDNLTAILKAI